MRIRRALTALFTLVAVTLGVTAGPAHALAAAVEGDGYYDGTPINDTQVLVEWGCTALTTGAAPTQTRIPAPSCRLVVNGVAVDWTGSATPGAFTATTPRDYVVNWWDRLQVCWTAYADFANGTSISDTTTPNCTAINTPFLGISAD
jgi:hypothetical protein